jgi:hypothetical protein
MKLLNKLYTYLVIRKSLQIRKDQLFIDYRNFVRKHEDFLAYSNIAEKEINQETFAYFIAETDGFSKSSEHYWLEAEQSIKELKTALTNMLYDNVDILKQYRGLVWKKYRHKL